MELGCLTGQNRPEKLIPCSDNSSDDESNIAELSMDVDYLMTPAQMTPFIDIAWGGELYCSGNSVTFDQSFSEICKAFEKPCLQQNSIVSNSDDDETLSSNVFSVTSSDQRAFEEMDDDSSDDSSEYIRILCKSNSNDKLNGSKTTIIHEFTSEDFTIVLTDELIALIEEQKTKSLEGFLDWKAMIPQYFGNHLGLLAEVFRVHLPSLDEGEYWFGSDFIINCNKQQIPNGVQFVGLIISEGTAGKKFLLLNGRKKVELKVGYYEAITNVLAIKVHGDGMFSLYNKNKPSFQKVCAEPSDLVFDYNPRMLFLGIITKIGTFKVNILGRDQEHEIDFFGNGCQVIYTDRLTKLQNIYSARVVILKVLSSNIAIMDFNYSSACYIRGEFDPKFIDIFIPAGANPHYF
ncbi:hypothetical protein HDV04_004710 [Boothiomyces sp. JEL0838]|nr:hypothetical protein HDV04_004710 [Boothiomyces sp. JEL0838]